MKIHGILKYDYHHRVSLIALENPEVIGMLRFFRQRTVRDFIGTIKGEAYSKTES